MRPDPASDLQVYRKWNQDPDLLDRVRDLFVYPPGEDRLGAHIYMENQQDWVADFAESGRRLLQTLDELLGVRFTVVVLQAYRNGTGCTWHDDASYEAQATLSLGVTRSFGVRWLDGDPSWLKVEHGDLVYMPPGFSHGRQHSVPEEHVIGERCSLVFRSLISV